MSQKIKIYKAISYITIILGVLVILCIYPAKFIRYSYQAKSDEIIAMESEPVSVENNITQLFTGVGGELKSVDLYVVNEMANEIITFRMYDEEHKQIYEQFVYVNNDFVAPGFLNIPIRFEMEEGLEYSFIIEGLSTDLYVAYEDRMTTTSPVNYYMAYGGWEIPEYDVIIRYNYSCPFSLMQTVIWCVVIVFVTILIIFASKRFIKGEIELKKVVQYIANPCIGVIAAGAVYVLLVKRLFGMDTKNNLFLLLGVFLLLVLIGYMVNYENIVSNLNFERIKRTDFRKCLQIIAIATAIWYCYEYINGLYDIFHYYSVTKLCIALSYVIIVSFDKEELLNIPNLVWLIAGPIFGYFYKKPYVGIEMEEELYRLLAWFWVAIGFVAINLVYSIIRLVRRKATMSKMDYKVALPLAILLIGLCVCANTREWPFLLAGICILIGFRLIYTGKARVFTENLSYGILLNFYMMMWFSLRHRVFYFYQYYRYPMGYHTVTVTAYYLSMIVGVAFVRLIYRMKEGDRKRILVSLITFGFAASYLIFTMSRTGFLSTGSMIFSGIIAITIICGLKGKRISFALKRMGLLIVATAYMFPITFMLTDLCPRISNDPVTFEFETRDFTFEEGMPYSSAHYMTIEQFVYEFGKKVFNFEDEWMVVSENFENPLVLHAYAMEKQSQKIDQKKYWDDNEEDVTDMSNGRFDIFKSYAMNFNLGGHEEMGVELPDGEIAYHAHNSFIQGIHDFGLIVGIYFILFLVYVLFVAAVRFKKSKDLRYDTVMPVLTVGFCAASMVEWLFHPCNPYGLVLFLCIIPMMVSEKRG